MKTLVIYYSYSGKTRDISKKLAEENGAELEEVFEMRKRNVLTAYVSGSLAAIKRNKVAVKPLNKFPANYDKIIICCPIWAGCPAPVFNTITDYLPLGAEIQLVFTSGSGNSTKSKDGTIELVNKCGCKVTDYKDIKTS